MKICNKCKENKELTAFSSNNSATDKLCPTCKACVSAYNKAYREANKQKLQEYHKEYHKANADVITARALKYIEDNREHVQQVTKDRYERNKDQQAAYYVDRYTDPELRQSRADKVRQWKLDNPERVLAQLAYRRARKLQATPKWADKAAILAIYKECVKITKETGIPHQVDHIIPLNGVLVSGLHVESNLQIITAEENNKKNNKFNIDA